VCPPFFRLITRDVATILPRKLVHIGFIIHNSPGDRQIGDVK